MSGNPKNRKTRFFGDFKEAVKTLRAKIPPAFPVRVTRAKLTEHAGDCGLVDKGKKRFSIRVSSELSGDAAVMVLLHEWSHAVSWKFDQTVKDHGPEWGLAYSRVYCCWMETE